MSKMNWMDMSNTLQAEGRLDRSQTQYFKIETGHFLKKYPISIHVKQREIHELEQTQKSIQKEVEYYSVRSNYLSNKADDMEEKCESQFMELVEEREFLKGELDAAQFKYSRLLQEQDNKSTLEGAVDEECPLYSDEELEDRKASKKDCKKVFLKISKLSHPDRISHKALNEIFIEAYTAFEDRDLTSLLALLDLARELRAEHTANKNRLYEAKTKEQIEKEKAEYRESLFTNCARLRKVLSKGIEEWKSVNSHFGSFVLAMSRNNWEPTKEVIDIFKQINEQEVQELKQSLRSVNNQIMGMEFSRTQQAHKEEDESDDWFDGPLF